MTKIEQAAAALEHAERQKDLAFSKASSAREQARRALRELRAVIAAARQSAVAR